jgi:uncharacterized membrane protein YccC
MALAGTAAYYCAQFLRLDYPYWSVLTVILLVMAQYVGAIQEKAFFRMVGTVIGGLLGYLTTGAWQQSPGLYLTTSFVIVAFCVAMFSQSRAPYAFFLTGLTYVVIASSGQANPDMSWSYALARIEEVLLGVIASVVVQSLVFPRYANRDFVTQLRLCFNELADATRQTGAVFRGTQTGLAEALHDFPTRASQLRTLLRFGARESRFFRRDIASYAQMVSHIVHAANLLRSLASVPAAPEPYRDRLAGLIDGLANHLSDGWVILQAHRIPDDAWTRRARELDQSIDATVASLRGDPAAESIPAQETGNLSIHLLTLRELQETLLEVARLSNAPSDEEDRPTNLALAPAWPDRVWIRHGLRAALATVIALVLVNWLTPPGGNLMVLGAFVFTAMNALSPEGSGDRGAFRYVVIFTLVIAGAAVALIAGTPLLSSYAVLNILLATWLFLLGYWMHDRGGVTVPVQVSFLLLISILSLNAQVPVPFQKIAGTFFGLVNGLTLAAVVQRLLWPVLPQRQLQHGVVFALRTMASCLHEGFDHLPLWQRARLGLMPSQARGYIRAMRGPTLPPAQAERLGQFVLTLQQVTGEIALCTARLRPTLPEDLLATIETPLSEVQSTLAGGLENLALSFEKMSTPADQSPRIDAALACWDATIVQLRTDLIARGKDPAEVVQPLGQAARYRAALGLLRRAQDEARQLKLDDYLCDVAL